MTWNKAIGLPLSWKVENRRPAEPSHWPEQRRRAGGDEKVVDLEPERYSQKMRQKRYDEVVLVAHHSIVY